MILSKYRFKEEVDYLDLELNRNQGIGKVDVLIDNLLELQGFGEGQFFKERKLDS